jgi:hypothetical protein
VTIDERIRDDLKFAASVFGPGAPPSVESVKGRGLRRRRSKRTGWILLSGVPVLLFLALAGRFDPDRIDPSGTHGVDTVEVADLAVPVTDGHPVSLNPDIWRGLRGPSPRFDTSQFGPDLSFDPGRPAVEDLSDRVKRAVYLGELEGEPFYVYSQSTPSIWDRIFEAVAGNSSGDTLGTSLTCCSGGDMDHEGGLPGFSRSFTTGEPVLIVAEWLGLAPDVSVVAYRVDGDFIGWQTPVGGTVSLRLDHDPEDFVMIAYGADGEEFGRYDPQAIMNSRPSTAESREEAAPNVSGLISRGIEIQLKDISPPKLQGLVELDADSLLYEVPIEGQSVYVVLGDEKAHVYSRSCDLLETSAIPEGLRATCLQRTVEGVTETGVFHLHEEQG